jgi:FkbM family methyltransferase
MSFLSKIKDRVRLFPTPIPLPLQGMYLNYLPLRMYRHNIHEPETTAFFKKNIKKSDVVVDVGALVGYYTVLFSRLGNKVIAFEPSPRNHRRLLKNIRRNKCKNVTVFPFAVGNTDSKRNLYVNNGGSGVDSLVPQLARDGAKTLEIDTYRMDSLVSGRVDFVKIDAEGTDIDVLEGMTRIITENPQIQIVLEFSPKHLRDMGQTAADFFKRIEELGLEDIKWLAQDGLTPSDLEPLYSMQNGHVNLLLKRKD